MAKPEQSPLHPTPVGGVDPALVGNGLITDADNLEKYKAGLAAGLSRDEAQMKAGDGIPFTRHDGTVGVARAARVAPARIPERRPRLIPRVPRLPRGVLPPRA